MAVNSSLIPEWCFFIRYSTRGISTSPYHQVTLTVCVVISLLALMAVAGNAFILAAIWKNPSLRTPSYVLLAGLAFADFCTGLLTQPVYIVYKLGDISGNVKMFCIAGVIALSVAYYFSSLTVIVITIMAVERWLHMSRRSLLTVRRVVILYITSAIFLIAFWACYIYVFYYANYTEEVLGPFNVIIVLGAAFCFSITVFAYYKVYRIIRHHQSQVQTNESAIDNRKYRKSVSTILCILAIFLLSYVPFVCCIVVVNVVDLGRESWNAVVDACSVIMFSSSFFNPLLYYWRIREIRDSVRSFVRN